MNTTKINPGSLSPYQFKSIRGLASSFFDKVRKKQMRSAIRFLVTELSNRRRKAKILHGSDYYCPVCDHSLGGFIHLGNEIRFSWNSTCPYCSSRSRHRGLFFLYRELLNRGEKVIHFAPEPVFYELFNQSGIVYETSDYFLQDVDYPAEDIQALSFEEGIYDLVLCNHVIEHVPDDEAAISEMYRILKPGGKAVITVPGDFTRLKTIYFDHLDFNGHYRDYGLDFKDKLEKVFDEVKTTDLHKYDGKRHGIKKHELAFTGIKSV